MADAHRVTISPKGGWFTLSCSCGWTLTATSKEAADWEKLQHVTGA
ncbi:hypothetical protein [Frankia sp. AvcI1]|nr:hypothetical protein [Frankia sp. AvcI1]